MSTRWEDPQCLSYAAWHYKSGSGVRFATSSSTQSTYSTWKGQYQGRLGVSPSERQQRLKAVTISIQIPQQFTRSFHYIPVCQQDQCSVTTILQLKARPSSQSSGCLFSPLGAGQTIPVSTCQSHRDSLNQDSNRSDRVCLSHSPSLASTGLVPTVAEVAG